MRQQLGHIVRRTPIQERSRALVKTAGYRAFMIVITFIIAFLFTDDVGTAVNIGVAANIVKTVTYYLYERLWDRIDWGLGSTTTT